MAARLSTGLVKYVMDTGSFRAAFDAGFIDIWTGSQPAAADDAATGTKLVTLYRDGVSLGIQFEATAPAGVLQQLSGQDWSGTAVATGTAGWFRMRESGDAGTGTSTTAKRFDGAVGTSGAEMNLGSVAITSGGPVVITGASFTLPKS